MQYRTEIVVPEDRYVCVLLPDYLPPGRAVLTVTISEPDATEPMPSQGSDPEGDDRDDIEWWDEFDAQDA